MSDEPKPEADALEQAQPLLDEEEDLSLGTDDPEVPEADAAEQSRAVVDDEEDHPD